MHVVSVAHDQIWTAQGTQMTPISRLSVAELVFVVIYFGKHDLLNIHDSGDNVRVFSDFDAVVMGAQRTAHNLTPIS